MASHKNNAGTLPNEDDDPTTEIEVADGSGVGIQAQLNRTVEQKLQLSLELTELKNSHIDLSNKIAALNDAHTEEIRIIRFELGEAQETLSQHELVAEQLASHLVDSRSTRISLEEELNQSKDENHSRVEKLEKDNHALARELKDAQEKLVAKSEAINGLMLELASKSSHPEATGDIEEVIREIDDRVSEHIDDRVPKQRDRFTRVLIGSVDGRDLRFPLFKNRLTIGRTAQNDISLRASYVSRRHAVIATDGDATRVIDWGSKNGVFVNSMRIDEHFLRSGDKVTIGSAEFRYEERPKRG
jgi:hypothetical protein